MQERWIVLSNTLAAVGTYYQPRLTPRLLSERYYAGRAVIRMNERTVQAYTALWRTSAHPNVYELGTVWVGEQLRGNGLSYQLMAEAMALAPSKAELFLITPERKIGGAAVEFGFSPTTTQTDPELLKWASDVGIVCRLPESIHPIVPGIWRTSTQGERWLYRRRGN